MAGVVEQPTTETEMLTEKKLNEKHAPTEVWVTHYALDTSEPERQWLDGASDKPWGADYNAQITEWAAQTRYVRADMVDPRDEVIARLVEALENRLHDQECPCNACSPMLAAIAAAKAVQHG